MDFEAQRKKRLEALEEKKKRLDEMKKIKQDRDSNSRSSANSNIIETSKERNDVDDLVNSLLQPSSTLEPAAESIHETVISKIDLKHAVTSTDKDLHIEKITSLPNEIINVAKPIKQKSFSIVKSLAVYQILPTQIESYEKGTQTDTAEDMNEWAEGEEGSQKSGTLLTPYKIAHRRPAAATTSPAPTHRSTGEPTGGVTSIGTDTSTGGTSNTLTIKKLNDEEMRTILNDDDFAKFLTKSSHIIERAVGQTSVFDLLESYQLKHPKGDQKGATKALTKVFTFTDDSVKSRPIMDIQFSPHFPELFLVAYGSKSSTHSKTGGSSWSANSTSTLSGSQEEPLGMVCVWSTGVHTKPEFKFYASSPVLSARFHDSEEHLIVGGCYSGQILVWDMRQKSLPVQRSSLTGKGHKHPIYSMAFVSTTATSSATTTTASVPSSELLTVSVDGLLCYWDLSRLTEPTNIINLQSLLPGAGTVEALGIAGTPTDTIQQLSLAITSLALTASTTSDTQISKEILLGSGTGHLYRGSLPLRPNQSLTQVDAHLGLISAMEVNPNPGKPFQSLLLTSSLDWSVKLWNVVSSTENITSNTRAGAGKQSHSGISTAPIKPVFEFISSSYDYVNDVRWCPINPSVFLTLSSCGSLSIWSLCKSTAEPTETVSLNDEIGVISSVNQPGINKDTGSKLTALSGGHAALNKAVWSRNGRLIVVGDSKGAVHMLHVHESVYSMTAADEGKLEVLLLGSGSTASASSVTTRADVSESLGSTTVKLEKMSVDED